MVWSENAGVSIILPADHVDGDGRNYIVVGESIPQAISDHFTAAIVFHNGRWLGGDIAAGSSTATVDLGALYPQGFIYWALGITSNGALELVAFYLVVPSPMGETYTTYRRTVFSSSLPVGVDKPPVFALGYNPNYGTYGDGSQAIVSAPQNVDINGSGVNMLAAVDTNAVNAAAPAGSQPIIKCGTWVGTTDASGQITITPPTPFPNGVMTAVCSPGDVAGNLNATQCFGMSKTAMSVRCTTPGGTLAASSTVRINYIMIGW